MGENIKALPTYTPDVSQWLLEIGINQQPHPQPPHPATLQEISAIDSVWMDEIVKVYCTISLVKKYNYVIVDIDIVSLAYAISQWYYIYSIIGLL